MGGSRIFLRRRVPDPDVQIRGARLFRPLDKGVGGGGGLPKNFFRPFEPQFGPKIRAGGPSSLPPGSTTGGDEPLRNGVTDC